MNTRDDSALQFPCRFPIKAMGLARDDLHLRIIEIVQQHVPELSKDDVTQRASSNGKYLSVTITIEATSREQLDAIYQDLTACELVMMAL
jgi:putative lipoic acid-binding regulatory protein